MLETSSALRRKAERNQIATWFSTPEIRAKYPKQMRHFALGKEYTERGLFGGNRTGKTHCGCYEDALHLTGRYPDWWEGFRFKKPVEWWAATDTAKNTRDILQDKYCGKIGSIGTGMIPGDTIVRWTPKHGLSDAIETIYVKHVSGGVSELQLKSYDQGRVAFQGTRKDGIHLDEEPPLEVYVECLLRLMSTSPKEPTGLLVLTETPLLGVSDLMMEFMPDLQPEPEAVPEQAWTEQEESDVEIVE
jgi:phage terminase large subunit-like protein